MCAHAEELLDLALVLQGRQWAILQSLHLLLLQEVDSVLEKLYLQVFLHDLLSLRCLQVPVLVNGGRVRTAELV